MDATMFKPLLLAMVVCCSCASSAIAEEYLLRIDEIGFVDRLPSEKDLPETTFRSVEVVVRPDSTFHTKTIIGAETVIVSGKLCPKDKGGFSLQIHYEHTVVDTGIILPNEEGIKIPGRNTFYVNREIELAVDESVTTGSLKSKVGDSGNPVKHSQKRLALVLAKHTPTKTGE